MIYKLKMLAEDDGELLNIDSTDLHIHLTNINDGYYITLPNKETITVIQEPNIINYLTEKFIDKVIK